MDQNLLRDYEDSLYRLDREFHIAGKLGPLLAREYFRRVCFEYLAYMLEWNHDWSLASALVECWQPESHTFHLPYGEKTITRGYIMQIIGDVMGLGCAGLLVPPDEQHNMGNGIWEDVLLFCYHGLTIVFLLVVPTDLNSDYFLWPRGYEPPWDREETRLRGWRWILNRLGIVDGFLPGGVDSVC
ncbi:hypothetical protein PIB30_045074 [Stylosanthes scabra]|uniref:Aminotransferase-like plant mobile domain-containing protein n=1 Tax=Stylosanthes scabra TaxID=79078 RepID=A0ABU6WE18_9FABA|nr:hypothetical protein [Stylosanthes scabra]